MPNGLPPVLEVSWPGYNSAVKLNGATVPAVRRAVLDVAADDLPTLTLEVLSHDGPQSFSGLFVPEGSPEYELVCKLFRYRG